MSTRTQGKTTGPVRHTSARGATRQTGAELRALGWLLRHPLFGLLPLLAVLAVRTGGPVASGSGRACMVSLLLVWRLAHPALLDLRAAPRNRSAWRRWTVYRG